MMRESKKREKEFDGIADKFRFQRNMNDATMLATARAFITEAGPYAAVSKRLNQTFQRLESFSKRLTKVSQHLKFFALRLEA